MHDKIHIYFIHIIRILLEYSILFFSSISFFLILQASPQTGLNAREKDDDFDVLVFVASIAFTRLNNTYLIREKLPLNQIKNQHVPVLL